MIVDACLFAAERDMLELRLRTVGPYVDHVVVVGCERTHQGERADVRQIMDSYAHAYRAYGRPTPISFHWVAPQNVLDRGGRLLERSPDERGPAGSPWFQHIERQHRDGMLTAVRDVTCDPDTVVLMSDVDEIPAPAAIAAARSILAERAAWLVFGQRFHSTALDLLHPQQPWWGTCATRLADMRPQEHRDARTTIGTRDQSVQTIRDAGVHLSWFGSDEERRRKLETFSHAELRDGDPAEWRRSRVHANREPLRRLSVEESWPLWYPRPLLDGSFKIPDGWLSEDAWAPDA